MRSLIVRQVFTFAFCSLFIPGLYALPSRMPGPARAGPEQREQAPAASDSRFATVESASRDQWQKPQEVIKVLGIKPGHVVVDIGAGTGYFTRRFAEAVGPDGRAIAIEIEASHVRALAADAKRWNLENYEARLVPPDDPMLAPRSADIIFLCDTYHEIENRIAYFTRARAALKPEGRLVVVDFVRTPENPKHSIIKEEVIGELRQAGYLLLAESDLLLPKQYFLQFAATSPAEMHKP